MGFVGTSMPTVHTSNETHYRPQGYPAEQKVDPKSLKMQTNKQTIGGHMLGKAKLEIREVLASCGCSSVRTGQVVADSGRQSLL